MNRKTMRMSCYILIGLFVSSVVDAQPNKDSQPQPPEQLQLQAQAKVKTFAKTLKQALMSAVQQQGFEHAVAVCKDQAPVIAASLSTDGWTVARTSIRTRNQDNHANTWEMQQLRLFDESFKAGTPAGQLIAEELTDSQYRYMQAIPTGQLCLACHGQSIEASLAESIQAAYPNDKATGFSPEDIRGAFSLTKSLVHEQ